MKTGKCPYQDRKSIDLSILTKFETKWKLIESMTTFKAKEWLSRGPQLLMLSIN